MEQEIKIFNDAAEMTGALADDLALEINTAAKENRTLNVALSGGNTPKLLFSTLAARYSDLVDWTHVRFFWGDERCVPPGDKESNYGEAKRILLDRICIPGENIHRIMGENEPDAEAIRYSSELRDNLPVSDGFPVFDYIILGMGEDGHTASIFPDRMDLFSSENICETAVHPVSRQHRITLTGRTINNSRSVVFLVSGKNKSKILSEILHKNHSDCYPASLVRPVNGKLTWYLDKDASAWH